MGSLRLAAIALLLGSPAFAQSPTFGVGRTPNPGRNPCLDISISPASGEELCGPRHRQGGRNALFSRRGAPAATAKRAQGRWRSALQSNKGQDVPIWERGRGAIRMDDTAADRAVCDDGVDYINRGMPLGKEWDSKPMRSMR
jgi:hypothetical protein